MTMIVAGVFNLVGCSSIKNTTLTTESMDQVTVEVHNSNLTEKEKEAFDEIKTRADQGDYDVTGKSIGEVIADQEAYDADREAQREKTLALTAEVKRRHDDSVAQLNHALTVALVAKGFQPADWTNGDYKSYVTFQIAFRNNGIKTITAVKGKTDFRNSLGDEIYETGLEHDIRVAPRQVFIWSGTIDYNEFDSSLTRLKDAELSEIHFLWEPSVILFADGSKLEVAN